MVHPTLRYLHSGLLLVLMMLPGCRQSETLIIPDNTAPPDRTEKSFNRESYINRVYISLMGRKPGAAELQQVEALIPAAAPTTEQLRAFLSSLMSQQDYRMRAYDNARIDYLNNLDTSEISRMIGTFELILSGTTDPFVIQLANREIQLLRDMQNIPSDMQAGILTRKGMHRRCIHNWFYDQINMGSANFVISSFLNFFFRQPSEAEQTNGVRMVDGASASILLQTGSSKSDYLDIFFNSMDYAEGQVRDAYKRYLFREPTVNELSSLSVQFHQSQNYEDLQKHILSSPEYVYP